MKKNSLIFKLLGAFLVVIAIGALVMSILTSQATRKAFDLYTTRSGQVWAERLAPSLADYYAQSSSWQGVDQLLQSSLTNLFTPMGSGGMGMGRGNGTGQQAGGMMYFADQRIILADGSGTVITDTMGDLVGSQLTAAELNQGVPIEVNQSLVGTLIITPNNLASDSPASQFLSSVTQAIISSAVIAAGIALLIGALLFFQITAPVQKLKKAAASIADGDLAQRVDIRSHDELGELGSTFNKMAESLARAEEQRQHMMADVAHELRTPLAAIQGTLEGMQDGVLPVDSEQVDALYAETSLLNRLVGDLRLLSLAEAGALKLERQKTDAVALVQKVADRAVPLALQKKVAIKTDLEAGLTPILMDSDRITQVINNLISNALRFTPEGGSILLKLKSRSNSGVLEFSVEDTGAGIDPGNLPYVFDRFYRTEKSRNRASGGSGLGLAIVKQLVEAHGGSVKAESPIFEGAQQNGYGTRISFTLPF